MHILDGALHRRWGDGFLKSPQGIRIGVGMPEEKLGRDAFLKLACHYWVVRQRVVDLQLGDRPTDIHAQAATVSFGEVDRSREDDWSGGRLSQEGGQLAIQTLLCDLYVYAGAASLR